MGKILLTILLVCLAQSWAQFDPEEPCFCKAGEAVGTCECGPDSVDVFNNQFVQPLLQRILTRDFFKFYKVNMERPCPYWSDDAQCGSKECGIGYCDDEVPEALRRPLVEERRNVAIIAKKESELKDEACESETGNRFDPLDRSLTEVDKAQLQGMEDFEDTSDKFCDVENEDSNEMHYVNMAKNPERYTGYKGNSAQKVWQSIYQENCFKYVKFLLNMNIRTSRPDPRFDKNFLVRPTPAGMCLEKRVFYRLISGLHSAITISIASHNYKPAPAGFGEGSWFRNVQMFKDRFGTKWSWEGPERLKNVYFVYLLELRALVKAAPYLEKELFYTGNEKEDNETRQDVEQLLELCASFRDQFDETQLFTGIDSQARTLREEFRQHFVNISRIMDCVGCDKCRLWGKLQTHGMGTALKILFSDLPATYQRSAPALPFQLTRNEVVALFQSFGRYSSSIWEVNEFRKVMPGGLRSTTSSRSDL
ncbi:Endoplasmic Reticulum Oxidoreductin 1 [Aphelenchoides avenae]|nr:Endoplasmic Reticulum Oxidoreductin 1 [Aphelenchus avenae]